uniref:Uncharacterized protein n=1 Tax=Anguilla anguilla TaxID=7936 RepID=A0A0E9U3U0_ANGAN
MQFAANTNKLVRHTTMLDISWICYLNIHCL